MSKNKTADDSFEANATYAKKPAQRRELARILEHFTAKVERDEQGKITRPARTIVVEADYGVGKTAFIKSFFSEKNIGVAYFSGSALLPPDFALSFPVLAELADRDGATPADIKANATASAELAQVVEHTKYQLTTSLSSRLVSDQDFVIVIDEMNRISPAMMPTFMELFQSHRVAGLDIPNLAGVICARNPVGAGYIGTNDGDHAFNTRLIVFPVTANDIPWREALARQFADTDLSGVFEVYNSLDADARRSFPPRVIEHTVAVILAGLPTNCGLPIEPSGRMKIVTKTGEDVTKSTLTKVAEALGQPYRESIPDMVKTCARVAYDNGWGFRMVGGAGIGKTGLIEALAPELGCDMRIVSGPNMDPSSLVMLLPDMANAKVTPVLSNLVQPGDKPWVLVVDEKTLAPKNVANQLLEVEQEHSIAGEPLEGLRAVWALDNPGRDGAIQYRNRSADPAQVSRYHVNLEVTVDDIDWRSYLEGKYGEEFVKPFAEWWSQDLNPDDRSLIPPRVLDGMMWLHSGGLDVDFALPYAGPERVPVRTHTLKARLGNRKVLGLAAVIEEADNLLAILGDPAADEAEQTEIASGVVRSFQKADLKELEPHEDRLVEFISALPPHARTSIINAAQGEKGDKGRDKVMFWARVYKRTLEQS